jgi:hypothetical protein
MDKENYDIMCGISSQDVGSVRTLRKVVNEKLVKRGYHKLRGYKPVRQLKEILKKNIMNKWKADYSDHPNIDFLAKCNSNGMDGAIEFLKQRERENSCQHEFQPQPSSYSPTGILVCRKCGKV